MSEESEPYLADIENKNGSAEKENTSNLELTTQEFDIESSPKVFLSFLKQETQRVIDSPKTEFCKHSTECKAVDVDCFHPYKTEGCHSYQQFEECNL